MKKTVTVECMYKGKPTQVEFMQSNTDIVFRVGKKKRFDHLTSLSVTENLLKFHGLNHGCLLDPVALDVEQLPEIVKEFKVRVLSKSNTYGAIYSDRTLTLLKVASKGKKVFDCVINKRGEQARKQFYK